MPEIRTQIRNCPVCGGTDKSLIYRQQFALMSEESLLNGYQVSACPSCGFCFADDIPSQADFDRYYQNMSKYENAAHGGESARDMQRFEILASVIEQYLPHRTACVWEIGCAAGGLLAQLKKKGYSNVSGLDPAPASAEIARRLYGLNVLTGTIDRNTVPRGAAEMLILIGVLEHICELQPALEKLGELLSPAARIFITVPDASCYTQGNDAPFQEFSVEHINFFGPRSLCNLMLCHGLIAVDIKQQVLEVGPHTTTPVIHGIFERAPGKQTTIVPDAITEQALRAYVDKSAAEDRRIREKIEHVIAAGRQIIVWGTGAHTLRLLETSDLQHADIKVFVDSNPHYQGKTLRGRPIIAPSELKLHPEPVLISSRAYQDEIADQIQSILGCTNELVLLYEF